MSACRSCGAPIIWAVTETGKRIPLDPDPTPRGTIRLSEMANRNSATVITSTRYPGDGLGVLYLSHFATCPQADRWRAK